MFQHTLVSDIQSGIQIDENGNVSGSLIQLDDWIWDPYSFEQGEIKSAPYHFIALDFSDNEYDEQLTSVVVRNSSYPNEGTEMLGREVQKVLVEIRSSDDTVEVIQTNEFGRTYMQVLDLSGLTLL